MQRVACPTSKAKSTFSGPFDAINVAFPHLPPLLLPSSPPFLSFFLPLSLHLPLSLTFFPPSLPLAASIKWINERASIEIWWSQHALALLLCLYVCICMCVCVRGCACVWVRHKGSAKSLIYNHLHPTGKSLGMAQKKGKTAAGQRKTQEIRGKNAHNIRTFVCPVRKPIWGICKGRLGEGKSGCNLKRWSRRERNRWLSCGCREERYWRKTQQIWNNNQIYVIYSYIYLQRSCQYMFIYNDINQKSTA